MLTKKEIWLLLAALCFLVYANSLNNEFVSDDIPGILKNPFISQALRYGLVPPYFLYSINYLIAQENPFVYHLTNIILHFVNTLLVFYFLRLLFGTPASVLGASLFAVHPIHTEAVTWISGSPYLVMGLFILGGYLLYCRSISVIPQSNSPKKKSNISGGSEINTAIKIDWRYYLLSLFIFSYYLLENYTFYFLFPFFLVFADITFERWQKTWKLWLPFLFILLLRGVFLMNKVSGRVSFVSKEMGGGNTWVNPFFNLTYSFFSHLGLLIWPARLTLYHEPAVISSFALKLGIVSLILLALALFFIVKKAKEIFFGIGIFVLFLAPTYSPVTISWLVAERYLYFPSVFLSIVMAFCYERFIAAREKFKRTGLALFIFIIACYAVRAIIRNQDWKTPERLWRQTANVSYKSPRVHNNMGDVYSQEGNTEGAIREFKKAIELRPDYADAYHNLATVYYQKGELNEAIKLYKQAISFKPDLFESYLNLGIIYLNRGEYASAIEYLRKATEMRPESIEASSALKFSLEKRMKQ